MWGGWAAALVVVLVVATIAVLVAAAAAAAGQFVMYLRNEAFVGCPNAFIFICDKPTLLKNTIKFRPYRSRRDKLYLTSMLCTE